MPEFKAVEVKTLRDSLEPLVLQDIDAVLAGKFAEAESLSQKLDLIERWLPVINARRMKAEKLYSRIRTKTVRVLRCQDHAMGLERTAEEMASDVEKAHNAEPLMSAFVEAENAGARYDFMQAEYKVIKRGYRRQVFGDHD